MPQQLSLASGSVVLRCKSCNKPFDREASLRRHGYYCRSKSLATDTRPKVKPRSCLACVKAKRSCDRSKPQCSNCDRKRVSCVYPGDKGPSTRPTSADSNGDSEATRTSSVGIAPDEASATASASPGPSTLERVPDSLADHGSATGVHDPMAWRIALNLAPSPTPALQHIFGPLSPRTTSQATQAIRTSLSQILRSYPRMFAVHTIPPFIHPAMLSEDPGQIEPLQTCTILIRMLSDGLPGSKDLFWRNVRMECGRWCDRFTQMSHWELVAAFQALFMYMTVRLNHGDKLADNIDDLLIQTAMVLCIQLRLQKDQFSQQEVSLHGEWKTWILEESFKSYRLCIHLQTLNLLVYFDPASLCAHPAEYFSLEQIPSKASWEATTAVEWKRYEMRAASFTGQSGETLSASRNTSNDFERFVLLGSMLRMLRRTERPGSISINSPIYHAPDMSFPFTRKCDYDGCETLTRGVAAHCFDLCGEVRCPEHREAPQHECASWLPHQDAQKFVRARLLLELQDFVRLHTTLDRSSVEAQASALRPGHTCSIDMPTRAMLEGKTTQEQGDVLIECLNRGTGKMRDCNHHYRVTFDDGVKWILRCRRLRKSPPPYGLLRSVLDSEIQTMETLRLAGLPLPQVYKPPTTSTSRGVIARDSSDLGPSTEEPLPGEVPTDLYFFMDFIDAQTPPLSLFTIQQRGFTLLIQQGQLSPTHISRWIRSFARHSVKLSELSFTGIGSLYPDTHVGGSLVGPLINEFTGSSDPPYFLGPYRTNRDRWLDVVDHQLDLILNHGTQPRRTHTHYLHFLEVRDIISRWPELAEEATRTYIHHVDCLADQMFWDEEGNIIAWIDWERAQVTTKQEAFASPSAFMREECTAELTPYEEELVTAYVELGRSDLAECVRQGHKYHWLVRMCYPDQSRKRLFDNLSEFRHLILEHEEGRSTIQGASETVGTVMHSAAKALYEILAAKFKDDAGMVELEKRWREDNSRLESMGLAKRKRKNF